jgi:DivIVA domain-containing protein
MAEDLSPADIRARKFGASRRGFDRSDVNTFLERVASRVGTLEAEIGGIRQRLNQLGITELPNLRDELEDVGVEIQAVIDAAMTAAEGMRARAAADADETLAEADQASQRLRHDAWSTGTELLLQADGEADHLVAEAREDALFIRAEAEQEAKRLVADSRRQADDFVRSSRAEGERIVVIAKAESEAIIEGARQSADTAQERARALENRRSELLSELEAAESAIRDVETTRTEREAAPETSVRVISADVDERTHWPEDAGAVRILPSIPREPAAPEPVDAEAMAAEVEQMRTAITMPRPPEAVEVDVREEPASMDTPQPAVADPEPDVLSEGSHPEAEVVEEVVAVPEPAESESTGADEPSVTDTPAALEPAEEDVPHVEDKVTIVEADRDIDALFARLRQPAEPEPAAAPAADLPDSEVPTGEIIEEVEAVEAAPDLHVVPPMKVADEFERRDRMLLPIENRGLRGLKRRIVELQNRVLEELRTSSGEWRLGRGFVIEMMGDELDAVLLDSFAAGHTAAAESVGKEEPQLTGGPEQGAAELFTSDLHRDVQSVIDRGSSGGSRRLSSDVGRVFRSWRTDEAERHVRQAARRAFNDGLLAGYVRLGVPMVEVAAPGRPCGACAADSGISWPPDADLPEGVAVPPVGPSCAAMLVPAGSNGFDSSREQ